MTTAEEMYQFYLNMVKLSEDKMYRRQRIETRRAFFAAIGIIMAEIKDRDYKLDFKFMDDLADELLKFWKDEAKESN